MKFHALSTLALAVSSNAFVQVVIDEAKIAEFHSVVAAAMEAEGIRGAAYAFRGPVSVCSHIILQSQHLLTHFLYHCREWRNLF